MKLQIDFTIRIDYKKETSKFREYKKSIERVSMISDHVKMNPSFTSRSTGRESSLKKTGNPGEDVPLVEDGRESELILPQT